MNDITREAGVSKGTIYVYFENKEDLFASMIEAERAGFLARVRTALAANEDVETGLYQFGVAFITHMTDESVITAMRTVLGVRERMPDLCKRFFKGPENLRTVMQEFLERHISSGRLAIDDISLAAGQFIDMASGSYFKLRLFGSLDGPPPREEVDRVIRGAIRVFMAAYGGTGMDIGALIADPTAWVALVTLVVMEVVLGIDNLIFISILTNKLPPEHRERARKIGIGLALIMRLALLGTVAWIVQLTNPLFEAFGHPFSWKDLILIAGGLFLVYKATKEIHHNVDPLDHKEDMVGAGSEVVRMSFSSAIGQILLLDLVFSIDSIITAVGMTPHLPIMIVAVIAAVTVMLVAATPLANFIEKNPTIVMLALGFLLMIGATLIAEGFGVHVPKGYIYAAMAFSALVEMLNMVARNARKKKKTGSQTTLH
eukprot:g9921.t1